jgi:hypothetical protein
MTSKRRRKSASGPLTPFRARKYAIRSATGLLGQIDVRVAQQRHEVVGVGPHARVLEVDDVELRLVQHQVAAVIVAMAEDGGSAGQLADDDANSSRRAAR